MLLSVITPQATKQLTNIYILFYKNILSFVVPKVNFLNSIIKNLIRKEI